MKEKIKRRGFTRQQVLEVLEAQGRVCAKCGANLEVTGFHRDHLDGNRNNYAISNLQLLCPECHRAKEQKSDEHLKVQKDAMVNLGVLIQKGLDGELAGAKMERLVDAVQLVLKTSYQVNRVPEGIEYPVIGDKQMRMIYETGRFTTAYSDGYRAGINVGIAIAKNLTLERGGDTNYVE